jgi:hypothetical protein
LTKNGSKRLLTINSCSKTEIDDYSIASLRRDLPNNWRIKNSIKKLTTVANVFMPIEEFSISNGKEILKIFIKE